MRHLYLKDEETKVLTIYKINNKVLLYSTGNYIQYPVINHNGKEYEKEYIHSFNIVNQLYFNLKQKQKQNTDIQRGKNHLIRLSQLVSSQAKPRIQDSFYYSLLTLEGTP